MATRYATFQSVSKVTSFELSVNAGHSAAVVSPGATSTSFIVVSYDDSTANALLDVQACMSASGWAFVSDSGASPSVSQTRNYGALSAAPASPAPSQGDTYYNTSGKFLARYNGTDWIPEDTPGLAVPLVESGGNVAWDCATAPRATVTLTASGWTLVPTGMVLGGRYTLIVVQDGTGGRDLVFPSSTRLCRGPTLSPDSVTIYDFTCQSAGVLHLENSLGWRVKTVSATSYTVLRQDYQTTLLFTSATSVALAGISASGIQNFEFEVLQAGAGQVTLTPAGVEKIYWDPGVTAGSSSWTTLPQFNTQRIFTDGTGWYFR